MMMPLGLAQVPPLHRRRSRVRRHHMPRSGNLRARLRQLLQPLQLQGSEVPRVRCIELDVVLATDMPLPCFTDCSLLRNKVQSPIHPCPILLIR